MDKGQHDFERLRGLLSAVQIVHHTRGRIRLKLAAGPSFSLMPDLQLLQQARQLLESLPGVETVRLNPLAASCTVCYEPALIPAPAWGDFLAGSDSTAAAVLEGILRQAHQEIIHAKL